MTRFPLRRAILAGAAASMAIVPMIASAPAHAQFGGIVYPGQANPPRHRHQSGNQHRSAHLSSGTARHAFDLYGVGIVDLSAG